MSTRACADLHDASQDGFNPSPAVREGLTVEGLDLGAVGDTKTEAGTIWTDTPVQVLGTVHRDVLTVDANSMG